ncbi:MAG: SRPBCC domain-containing protein [Pseudomonadota bacterium]
MAEGRSDFERLELRRVVSASPERLFDAWTKPAELKQWWGPSGVRCIAAEVDLRVGGEYRIGNELPDKSVVWISGRFEVIERPQLLVYTWIVDGAAEERVRVCLDRHERGTSIVITHTMMPSKKIHDRHLHGWTGCLTGLAEYLWQEE